MTKLKKNSRSDYFHLNRKEKVEWIQLKYRDRKFLHPEIISVKKDWNLQSLLENQSGIKNLREFLIKEFSAESKD